ncbi:hypothetical protein GLOIN_2v1763023 [Rhizophagus irregularis DAOM 181602=DAOM 197198]|uniref:Uncharacterized protein n=1 Tax=Rhizophagus irregularis (strain DAOM 181602 / DAOM 197198 / MUCL 43194) TaxID=747089 RepID=A0A2P4QW11_RHIID|nr:hypothetical protein GLOIN_2v1763023 [Rhizophagus irregularis DAOM 181602=DAOM 197198]POG81782.1 hypothetical protein GLOIN_2v1763023 [Rhizophagus irregularis DAOM 181602=DAOM 197198]GET64740.1 hypothetical protein GLOIN_2v1763023 [Rhizophagus irregularis DAOM 181602=DAOM 197198]|eukprot:XP_025188648.1 hypothetical protein GLOIN_2v1763023 [Rhizophagus irregularis DAOM 181602=DAOM 197198]
MGFGMGFGIWDGIGIGIWDWNGNGIWDLGWNGMGWDGTPIPFKWAASDLTSTEETIFGHDNDPKYAAKLTNPVKF